MGIDPDFNVVKGWVCTHCRAHGKEGEEHACPGMVHSLLDKVERLKGRERDLVKQLEREERERRQLQKGYGATLERVREWADDQCQGSRCNRVFSDEELDKLFAILEGGDDEQPTT